MLGFNLACTGDGGRGWATPSQNLVDAYETLDGEIPVLNSESGDINPKSIYNRRNHMRIEIRVFMIVFITMAQPA